MLTVKEWMELVEYRITEGDSYLWKCFGDSAFSLSAWNGDQDGWSMNMVFDTQDQTVYIVEVCDYKRERAYRMINPNYKMVHDAEAHSREVNAKEAWDEVDYVDLDVDDDFIQKGVAVRDGVDYDTRVSVPLNVPDDVLFELMKKAHEQDVTLNKLVEEVLWTAIHAEESRQNVDREHVLDSSYPDGDEYWNEEIKYEPDDGALTREQIDQIKSSAEDMKDEYDFSNARSGSVAAMKAKKKKKDKK